MFTFVTAIRNTSSFTKKISQHPTDVFYGTNRVAEISDLLRHMGFPEQDYLELDYPGFRRRVRPDFDWLNDFRTDRQECKNNSTAIILCKTM